MSYDKFHNDSDRIYRVSAAYMRQGVWEPYASNSWKTAELIKTNYGEVEKLTRIRPDDNTLFEYGDKHIVENRFAWVDENFLEVFNFPLVKGDSTDALKGPNKVVISESVAEKYFGTDMPLGKAVLPDLLATGATKTEKDSGSKLGYVMIEIPIPGSCSYADRDHGFNPTETHREYFKEKTVIFCENMKAGRYKFDVKLLPRFTGTYFINPAQVSLMYVPVKNANTDMKTVVVK